VTDPSQTFHLEPVDSPPSGIPLVSDDDPHGYWLLSNGGSWKLALGQNIRETDPQIFAAETGVLFIGLYHGCAASIRPADGGVIDRVDLVSGNMVFWGEHGDYVVAEGEFEIAVFETGGKFLWRAALGDVLDKIELKDGAFELMDASGHTGRYEARSGRAL
jgi:hypothetical protein